MLTRQRVDVFGPLGRSGNRLTLIGDDMSVNMGGATVSDRVHSVRHEAGAPATMPQTMVRQVQRPRTRVDEPEKIRGPRGGSP